MYVSFPDKVIMYSAFWLLIYIFIKWLNITKQIEKASLRFFFFLSYEKYTRCLNYLLKILFFNYWGRLMCRKMMENIKFFGKQFSRCRLMSVICSNLQDSSIFLRIKRPLRLNTTGKLNSSCRPPHKQTVVARQWLRPLPRAIHPRPLRRNN